MSQEIKIISYYDSNDKYQETLLEMTGIVKHVRVLNDKISKDKLIHLLKKHYYTSTDLILVHNSKNLNIKEYPNVVYFSFGCGDCGKQLEIGEQLLNIINNVKTEKNISLEKQENYRKQIYTLTSKKEPTPIKKELTRFLEEAQKRMPNNSDPMYHFYISDSLKFHHDVLPYLTAIQKPLSQQELYNLIEETNDTIYLMVPFAGFGTPEILNLDKENISAFYNGYFLELKALQERSCYRIMFLFLSYTKEYIPNFFKEISTSTIQQNIDTIFLSPLKNFNEDNHTKFLFGEMLYTQEKKVLNFFSFDQTITIEPIKEYLSDIDVYQSLKKHYYRGLFFDNQPLLASQKTLLENAWTTHIDLKFKEQDKAFHDLSQLDIRTSMPFYLCSVTNKLEIIKNTFKNEQILDFLLIDDDSSMDEKYRTIYTILTNLFGENNFKLNKKSFNKNTFTKTKQIQLIQAENEFPNIRNSNFILVDFILDPIKEGGEGVFFGSDFIERIEKIKKEQDEIFRTWYFVTSFLSTYVHKFEIDKIMYEYYESATVQLGDSTDEKFAIFFIKKLVYFIYSKINIYIRIIKITEELMKRVHAQIPHKNLMRKLIMLMQTLRQQIDLLELRYNDHNVKLAKQFYALVINILEDYIEQITSQWEIREIKLQELKSLKSKLLHDKNHKEIIMLYTLIEQLSDQG